MLVFREKLWYTDKCESMNRCPGFQGAIFQPGLSGVSGCRKKGLTSESGHGLAASGQCYGQRYARCAVVVLTGDGSHSF